MAAIITDVFKTKLLQRIFTDVSNDSDKFYIGIGKSEQWDSAENVPTPTDRDGDGMGDNPMGIGADKFPDDPTQWGDIDGDGYGDNPLGNNPWECVYALPMEGLRWGA